MGKVIIDNVSDRLARLEERNSPHQGYVKQLEARIEALEAKDRLAILEKQVKILKDHSHKHMEEYEIPEVLLSSGGMSFPYNPDYNPPVPPSECDVPKPKVIGNIVGKFVPSDEPKSATSEYKKKCDVCGESYYELHACMGNEPKCEMDEIKKCHPMKACQPSDEPKDRLVKGDTSGYENEDEPDDYIRRDYECNDEPKSEPCGQPLHQCKNKEAHLKYHEEHYGEKITISRKLAEDVLDILCPSMCHDLVYRPPEMGLRMAADEIERKNKIIAELRRAIGKGKV